MAFLLWHIMKCNTAVYRLQITKWLLKGGALKALCLMKASTVPCLLSSQYQYEHPCIHDVLVGNFPPGLYSWQQKFYNGHTTSNYRPAVTQYNFFYSRSKANAAQQEQPHAEC
jgi:hypothetical protein